MPVTQLQALPDYAVYVWSSYGVATIALVWILLSSIAELRRSETCLKKLQNTPF